MNRLYARLIELQADAANAERAADAAKHQHTNNQPTNNDNMAETTGSVCGCVSVCVCVCVCVCGCVHALANLEMAALSERLRSLTQYMYWQVLALWVLIIS